MNYIWKSSIGEDEKLNKSNHRIRRNRGGHRKTKSYTDYDFKSLLKTETTPSFLKEITILNADTTQKTLDRIKNKEGEKEVIVDILNEVQVDSQQRDGFFQFRPYGHYRNKPTYPPQQLDQPQVKTINLRNDNLSNDQYDMFDKKYNFTEFLKENPRIDEKDEDQTDYNDKDEVPEKVASKPKKIKIQSSRRRWWRVIAKLDKV